MMSTGRGAACVPGCGDILAHLKITPVLSL
jgi:hypothetical protein